MKLSFIVPCYNEEKNIPLFFNDVKKSFNNSKYDIEIIFKGFVDKIMINDDYIKQRINDVNGERIR